MFAILVPLPLKLYRENNIYLDFVYDFIRHFMNI